MAKRKPKAGKQPGVNPWPKRLKALREDRDLTQAELAKLLRISQSQCSAFESGSRKPTRPIAYLIELLEAKSI